MKLTIKESNKVVLEVNKGYSAEVYNALDSDFKSEWDNKVDANYLTDQVELWLYNTEELEREIYNTRRKPHSIAYAAMLDLFQDVVMRYSNRKIQVTSDMAKRWLTKNGLKYEEVLAPIVARIEEDRADNKKTESIIRENVDEVAVEELVLYITNDGDLYRQIITPTINNLKRKIKRGVYDDSLALKAWMNVADAGVQKYDEEFGSGRGSLKLCNKSTREAIASELKDYYEDDVFEDADVKESVKFKRSRKSRVTESDDVVDRRGFVSLVKLNNYGSYSVLNDGYFVIKILADDDSDAKRQFNDFLSTDWKADWKNGTLPKYYEE